MLTGIFEEEEVRERNGLGGGSGGGGEERASQGGRYTGIMSRKSCAIRAIPYTLKCLQGICFAKS